MNNPILVASYPEGERSTLSIEVSLIGSHLTTQVYLDTPGWDRTEHHATTDQIIRALVESFTALPYAPDTVTCLDCHGKGYDEGFMCGPNNCGYGKIPCTRCQGGGRMPLVQVEQYQRGRELRAERIARHESMRSMCERLAVDGLNMVALSNIEQGRWDKVENVEQMVDAIGRVSL